MEVATASRTESGREASEKVTTQLVGFPYLVVVISYSHLVRLNLLMCKELFKSFGSCNSHVLDLIATCPRTNRVVACSNGPGTILTR